MHTDGRHHGAGVQLEAGDVGHCLGAHCDSERQRRFEFRIIFHQHRHQSYMCVPHPPTISLTKHLSALPVYSSCGECCYAWERKSGPGAALKDGINIFSHSRGDTDR